MFWVQVGVCRVNLGHLLCVVIQLKGVFKLLRRSYVVNEVLLCSILYLVLVLFRYSHHVLLNVISFRVRVSVGPGGQILLIRDDIRFFW